MGAPRIVQLLSAPVGGDPERKRAFRAEATRLLKALAVCLDLPKGAFDLRWNEGGPAVSGEATLHAEAVYVQLYQGSFGDVMFRRCAGRRDYCGERNHWASAWEAADPVAFADRIRHELRLPEAACTQGRLL